MNPTRNDFQTIYIGSNFTDELITSMREHFFCVCGATMSDHVGAQLICLTRPGRFTKPSEAYDRYTARWMNYRRI